MAPFLCSFYQMYCFYFTLYFLRFLQEDALKFPHFLSQGSKAPAAKGSTAVNRKNTIEYKG